MVKKSDNDEVNNSLKLLANSSVIVFLGILLSKVAGYLYRIIVARQFDPEVYGAFSLALVVSGLFAAIFSFGIGEGLARYIPYYRGKEKVNKIRFLFRTSLMTLLISGIVATILMYISSDLIATRIFHDPSLGKFLKLFSLTLVFSMVSGPLMSTIRAYEKIGWHSFIFNILQNFAKVGGVAILILLGFEAYSVAWSHIIASIVMAISAYLVCKYVISVVFVKEKLSQNEKRTVLKEVYHYSWPFVLLSLSAYVITWIDSIMIGYYKTVYDVGVYNVAVTLSGLFLIIPMLFMQLLFPLLAKELGKNKKSLAKEISKQVTKWILMLNIPILIMVLLFPGVIINILFGEQYLGASNSLRIISIGIFFLQLSAVSRDLVNTSGKSKLILFDYIFASLLNTALNLFLVPFYGIEGAAFSTMLAYLCLASLYFIQAKKYVKIVTLRRKMIGVIFAAILPTTILVFMSKIFPSNTIVLIFSGLIFMVFYLGLILLFRVLDRHDLVVINNLLNKAKSTVGKVNWRFENEQ